MLIFLFSLLLSFTHCCDLQFDSEYGKMIYLNNQNVPTYLLWIVIIYAPINMLFILFLLISTIVKLRIAPGDICIGAYISELLICIHTFIMALNHPLIHQSFFCQFSAQLGIVAQISNIQYNIIFYIYLIVQMGYPQYLYRFDSWIHHLLIIFLTFMLMLYFFLSKQTGKNNQGWCLYAYGSSSLYMSACLLGILVMISLVLFLYSYWLSPKKQIVKQSSGGVISSYTDIQFEQIDQKRIREEINPIKNLYIQGFKEFSTFYAGVCILLWCALQALAICQSLYCDQTAFDLAYEIMKLVYTTILPLVRSQEPKLKEIYQKIFNTYFKEDEMFDDFIEQYAKNIINEQQVIENYQKKNLIFYLNQSEKNSPLFRLLAFIYIMQIDKKQKVGLSGNKLPSESIFKERVVYKLNDSILRKLCPRIPYSFFSQELNSEVMKVTKFWPDIDLEDYLIDNNLWNLKQACNGQQSKIIFFNTKNQIMIRQISNIQRELFLKNFEKYYNYMTKYKSYIQQIIGIVYVEGIQENGLSFAIFKGITGRSDQIYSLTGQNRKSKSEFLLFDQQFQEQQIKLGISQQTKDQLILDSKFLASCGYTCYEMLVVKDELCIVEYLQTYDQKKRLLQMTNKLKRKKNEIESLIQPPQGYSNRFIKMIQNLQ